MAQTTNSLFLLKRINLSSQNLKPPQPLPFLRFCLSLKPYSTFPSSSPGSPNSASVSSRMSYSLGQFDSIEPERAQRELTLRRIRAWRESQNAKQLQNPETISAQNPELTQGSEYGIIENGEGSLLMTESSTVELKRKKAVMVAHPWPEWIELMERLMRQNYFDHRRKDEGKMMRKLGFDASELGNDDLDDFVEIDFAKNFKAIQNACLNFGKDRFDILRSLSRQDIKILVGYGCPSAEKKVTLSAKLLRKRVHLDEGDVCSNCSLRNSCETAYLLAKKEGEARTFDLMRVLLTYGFDPVNGSVVNKSLLKQKSVRTVVRKLLHEVVKLSAVPIDPNLPRPVMEEPPPKVKQPPPPPKRRVGHDDIEMRKGDWLCPKCDFMNFAKNSVCLKCDAKRPKRQLLPGEWECPECNFLNYRKNMTCFHCDCKRPPDEFMENKMQETQRVLQTRLDKISSQKISNAWNFDFDDNESDGADVAAFEYADTKTIAEDSVPTIQGLEKNVGVHDGDLNRAYSDDYDRPSMGLNDFDDEDDVESCELDSQTNSSAHKAFQNNFYESDEFEHRTSPSSYCEQSNPGHQGGAFSASEDDIESHKNLFINPKWKSSRIADDWNQTRGGGWSKGSRFGSGNELDLDSDTGNESDDFNDNFGSCCMKKNRSSGRRNLQNFDFEDVSFCDSEADQSDLPTRRERFGGNKKEAGRKGNKQGSGITNFQRSSDLKYSFTDSEFDDRGSPGKRLGGNKMEHGGRGNKIRGKGDSDFVTDSDVRSKSKMGNRKRTWTDERPQLKGPNREGSRNRPQGRSHKHNMDMDTGTYEFKNRGRVIER